MIADHIVCKNWAEREMEAYDNLPAEMRKLVQKYGMLPGHNETVEQYQRSMNIFYPEGAI